MQTEGKNGKKPKQQTNCKTETPTQKKIVAFKQLWDSLPEQFKGQDL